MVSAPPVALVIVASQICPVVFLAWLAVAALRSWEIERAEFVASTGLRVSLQTCTSGGTSGGTS